jgi:translation initiation factor IF-3
LVIDETGEHLGVLTKQEALRIAEEKELDLVEVSPSSNPPVAKILSWSKFKYQLEKKRKETKNRRIDMKEMWFKAFIDKGDLEHKLKKVKEFLSKKHPVKITIKAKGRVSNENINGLIQEIIVQLKEHAELEGTPKNQGRNVSFIVKPIKHNKINLINEENETKS